MGAGGEQRGDGRGRAFVNVGAVNLEWRGDDFEAQADEDQREADDGERIEVALRGDQFFERGLHQVNARGARGAVHHGDAVEEKRGGEGAEDEIFQRGFVGFYGAAAEAGEDVAGDGAHFQADERGDEFVRTGEDAHAGCGEQDQRIIFAALDAFLVEILHGTENREGGRDDHDYVDKNAEGIGADQIVVSHARIEGHESHGGERHERAGECEPSQDALFARGRGTDPRP